MLTAIETIDFRLLLGLHYLLLFLSDWLSWRQRAIERVLIFAYVASFIASTELNGESRFWYICMAVAAWGLISLHRLPNSVRAVKLSSKPEYLCRFMVLAWLILSTSAEVAFTVIDEATWRSILDSACAWTFLLSLYVVALPSCGSPGRKRKAAVAKIVDSFGKEYVPEAA